MTAHDARTGTPRWQGQVDGTPIAAGDGVVVIRPDPATDHPVGVLDVASGAGVGCTILLS
jgi:hypothetical protein